jgi:hypothetical protein
MTIEESFIDSISLSLKHLTETSSGWKFQCPYCQHGVKNHNGKDFGPGRVKGNFYTYNNRVIFHCFRCGVQKEFASFLRDHFPKQFLQYVQRREELGLTGYQTNCPSLATVLKQQGMLPQRPPVFPSKEQPQEIQQEHPSKASAAPSAPSAPKVTKLPPMRSPQQQAGCQASLNRKMKQREQRRRERQGW